MIYSRSPIYALFSETLDGLPTIRAFCAETRLAKQNDRLLDINQRAFFLNFSANCWLAVRLELAGTMIVTFAALFAVLGRSGGTKEGAGMGEGNQQFAGLAGLAVSLALSVTQSLNWSVRMASDLESQMVSVERIREYATMLQEAPHFLNNDKSYDMMWPRDGKIEFVNASLQYRDGLPLVLKRINLVIGAREKVGIVGRTGAGKSSLVTALLRLVELQAGSILIDGRDISTMGLNVLRSKMAVIPQDPGKMTKK